MFKFHAQTNRELNIQIISRINLIIAGIGRELHCSVIIQFALQSVIQLML